MKKAFGVLAVALLVTTAHAQTYRVLGPVNCAKWGVLGMKLYGEGWVLGYVSAMNGAGVAKGDPDVLQNETGEQLIKWMNQYCKSNTLSNSMEGGKQMYQELLHRNGR
jgi:hypothetical protein